MRDFDSIKQKEIGSIENRVRHIYNRGYEDGYKDGDSNQAENSAYQYERGMNDAWECAGKIVKPGSDGGFYSYELRAVFGTYELPTIFSNTASEAIEKVKAWEEKQEKKHEIKVGDEILCSGTDDKAIVTKVIHGLEGDLYRCVHSDGDLSTETSESKPTGRFFPEITELFVKVDESVDESHGSVDERVDERVDDCISREKTMQIIREWFDRDATPSELKNAIEQMPSVTPAEKVGHWEWNQFDDGEVVRCSECKEYYTHERKYCPNCGARMEVNE
jgi:hypothetical protein